MPNFNDKTRGQVIAERTPTGYQYFYVSPAGDRELIRRQDKVLHPTAFKHEAHGFISWSFGKKPRHHNGQVSRTFKMKELV